ncbi:MAG: cell division protein ZapA [Taibaiella sp.]|nr:cell division protein ZapA [Taibaiella sp.]
MENGSELIPVTLWIAERGYRIKVKKEDEEAVRMAVKIADNKVNELRQTFAGKDDQDFLAMCLLMYATDQVTEADELNPVVKHKIQELIGKIDTLIKG